jgi:hypothetical protein
MKKFFIMFSALLLSLSLIARDPGPGEIDDYQFSESRARSLVRNAQSMGG